MSPLYHNTDLRQAAPVTAAQAWSPTPIYKEYGTWRRYVAYRYRQLRNLTREQTNAITLRLGNGCSATATRAGNSVDTSMGLTPLEGPVTETWSGGLDSAIVDFIATKEGLSSVMTRGSQLS